MSSNAAINMPRARLRSPGSICILENELWCVGLFPALHLRRQSVEGRFWCELALLEERVVANVLYQHESESDVVIMRTATLRKAGCYSWTDSCF